MLVLRVRIVDGIEAPANFCDELVVEVDVREAIQVDRAL